MNWFDYTLLGIIGLSAVISLFRGLIREVFSLLIWVGAFWVAYHFVDKAQSSLTPWIDLPSARHLIAFVALFLAALLVGGLLNYILGKLVSKTGLTGSDRFFGLFFGVLRGVVAVVAMAFFIQATPLAEDPWWKESRLAPYFGRMAEWVRERMPDDFADYFSFARQQASRQKEPETPVDNSPNEAPVEQKNGAETRQKKQTPETRPPEAPAESTENHTLKEDPSRGTR